MKTRSMMLAAAATLSLAAGARAQQRPDAAAVNELRAMASQPTQGDADRSAIRDFLARGDVSQAAEAYGLDVEAAADRVATLSDDDAASLADRVRRTEHTAQVGGDTFVISTTAVIIALLVLILIEVS